MVVFVVSLTHLSMEPFLFLCIYSGRVLEKTVTLLCPVTWLTVRLATHKGV